MLNIQIDESQALYSKQPNSYLVHINYQSLHPRLLVNP